MGRQGSGQKWSSRFRRGRVVRSELFVKWNHSDNLSDALRCAKIEKGSKISCMFQVDFFIWMVEFDRTMLLSRHACVFTVASSILAIIIALPSGI